MSDAIRHRGPDDEGVWVSANRRTGLAHRRLSILDTSERGHQPMSSSDGRYTIVFNGEVFDFLELRVELEQAGIQFRTDTDTEVILEAWRQWGPDMLLRFNGMWAFAISDNQTGELFLARDRFGIKPLLYTNNSEHFAFASEMRALIALPWLSREMDTNVVARLMFDAFSVEGSERTYISSIQRLPGGHFARLRDGKLEVKRWWRTTDHLVDTPSDPKAQADRFRELLIDSVRLRMRSDVQLGTSLSGGFDSSAIAGVMAYVASDQQSHLREAKDWRHAFIASFPGQSNDETQQALEAAAFAKVTPHVMAVSNDDALAEIDQVLETMDDIYIGLPTAVWQIYREQRRANNIVSLDGHGADEMMGGYRQSGQAFNFLFRNLVAGANNRFGGMRGMVDSAKAAWLSARGLNFLRGHQVAAPASLDIPADNDPLPREWGMLNRRLYRMFHATVLPTILRNFDRLSMSHGIEVRMPFMDWRLVTYTMSLPDAAKSSGGLTKLVARHALLGLMPDSIRLSPQKIGFNSPMPHWLNGPLHPWVTDVLQKPNAAFEDMVDSTRLRARVDALHAARKWDWESVGRIWPYIHLKWYLDRRQIGT